MLGSVFAHLLAWLLGSIPPDDMRRILASIPANSQGVLNIDWGAQREQILQALPASLVQSIAANAGRNPDILQGRVSLGRHPLTFTFLLRDSRFYSLTVGIVQRCRAMNDVVSSIYGQPIMEWPMPGNGGQIERHTLWACDGFEVLTELTPFNTGSLVVQMPQLSKALKGRSAGPP